jgi:hypothetical protein
VQIIRIILEREFSQCIGFVKILQKSKNKLIISFPMNVLEMVRAGGFVNSYLFP